MLLLSIEERVSNIAEQTFAELSLSKYFEATEVEDLESCHASKVNPMGQVDLELLNLLLQVDLIKE